MELRIYVTETESELIYKLDPLIHSELVTLAEKMGIRIHITPKFQLSLDTKDDYEYYHGNFERTQVLIILIGITSELLKKLGFTSLAYYRFPTDKIDRIPL